MEKVTSKSKVSSLQKMSWVKMKGGCVKTGLEQQRYEEN